MTAAIRVEGLGVELAGGVAVVDDVSFEVRGGEVLGIVGESGSGKTTVGTALLAHARRGARISRGEVHVGATDVLACGPDELRRLRGATVAYVPQDPAAALNPALRIGTQLREVLTVHGVGSGEAEGRIAAALEEVRLPAGAGTLRRFPHQLSGGQQQRICIAMAFLLQPAVVVLDEPTTGLDVTTQSHVLSLLRGLCSEHDVAAVYISHDLAVVSQLADRVMVLYAGRTVETGTRDQVLLRPRHPYTQQLLRASPDVRHRRALSVLPGTAPAPGARPTGCAYRTRCHLATAACALESPGLETIRSGHEVACHRVSETERDAAPAPALAELPGGSASAPLLEIAAVTFAYGERAVLRDVTLSVQPRECVAVVGESGSGKTTLSQIVAGLQAPASGAVRYRGQPLAGAVRDRQRDRKQAIQYVFQNPYLSLNPRKTVREILRVPVSLFHHVTHAQTSKLIDEALEEVGLSVALAGLHPSELSGGERQRVAIARAIIAEPALLICDEVTSALDVSAQASIVALLRRLIDERDLGILFVTHDLALVRAVADRCAVLEHGEIVELAASARLIDAPQHPYTRSLIADTPMITSPVA